MIKPQRVTWRLQECVYWAIMRLQLIMLSLLMDMPYRLFDKVKRQLMNIQIFSPLFKDLNKEIKILKNEN
jgi:hypothetical protein